MREYFGETIDYVGDEMHKVVPWKSVFSFELYNNTEYTLRVKIGSFDNFTTVKSQGIIQIQINIQGYIFVSTVEEENLECDFTMGWGTMLGRKLEKHVKGEIYIAPVFRNGVVTIVACNDCGPNLGVKPECKIDPLKNPGKVVKVYNFTPYDITMSHENTILQKLRGRKENERCTSEFLGVPVNGILYVDTLFEEIVWTDEYKCPKGTILRVNGCCIEISKKQYIEKGIVIGPAPDEPYIRHLYVSFREDMGIEIWCNTIDFRFD